MLCSLNVAMSGLQRPAEARQALVEAIGIRRELVTADPEQYLPGLASVLVRLGSFSPNWTARETRWPPSRKPSRCTGSWPPPVPTASAQT